VTRKILIVDGRAEHRDRARVSPAAQRLRGAVGADGEAALKQVEQHVPDLVLLDVMMSLKGGYEVCQRMRERPDWQHIRSSCCRPEARGGGEQGLVSRRRFLRHQAFLQQGTGRQNRRIAWHRRRNRRDMSVRLKFSLWLAAFFFGIVAVAAATAV